MDRSARGVEEVVAALHRLRSAIAPDLIQVLLRLDLTMAQFHALLAIRRRGPLSGRQLAAELKVTPAAVVALCTRLEEQDLIERVRDRDDRRVWWLQLTAAGRRLFDDVISVPRSRIGPALASLPADDRASLARIMNALADALDASDR